MYLWKRTKAWVVSAPPMLLCCTHAAENRQALGYLKRKQNQLSRSLCFLGSLTVFAPFSPTPPSSEGRWDSIPRSLAPVLSSCCSSCYSKIRKEIWHGDTPRLGCQEKYQLWGRSIYEAIFKLLLLLFCQSVLWCSLIGRSVVPIYRAKSI